MKIFKIVLLSLLLLAMTPVSAQGPNENDDCPALVAVALETAGEVCRDIGRNQVCYGHNLIDASGVDGALLSNFTTSGDTAAVTDLRSIATAGMNTDNNVWGIAVMSLQANIPGTLPGQSVTFVVYGDSSLTADTEAPDDFAAPMQAFQLTTGIGQPQCREAPHDGMLVQAPDGVTVNFMVNGVEVAVGSTIKLDVRGDNGDTLWVSTLEGSAEVSNLDVAQTVEPGFISKTIPGQPPTEPEPLENEDLQGVPVDLLPRPINVPFVLPAAEATADWIESRFTVAAGQTYTITATGETNLWPDCREFCQDNDDYTCADLCPAIEGGPAGTVPVTEVVPASDPYFVLPGERFNVLLARIDDGDPFVVGDDYTFTPDVDGTLYFRINEDTRVAGDEPGAYVVYVEAEPESD